MSLINCEFWTLSDRYVLLNNGKVTTFAIICKTFCETFATSFAKLHVSVVILSIQDNAEVLQLMQSGFKRTIICNKYQL